MLQSQFLARTLIFPEPFLNDSVPLWDESLLNVFDHPWIAACVAGSVIGLQAKHLNVLVYQQVGPLGLALPSSVPCVVWATDAWDVSDQVRLAFGQRLKFFPVGEFVLIAGAIYDIEAVVSGASAQIVSEYTKVRSDPGDGGYHQLVGQFGVHDEHPLCSTTYGQLGTYLKRPKERG